MLEQINSSIDYMYKSELKKLGIVLDISTGHLFYAADFIPLKLNYELVFIRHGETYGNCGQINSLGKIDENLVELDVKNVNNRIFQGCVDEPINQLTRMGIYQAHKVAASIEDKYISRGWKPDAIFHSPLTRAKDTGLPFIESNNLWHCYYEFEGITEMSFGAWDNRRICDISSENKCHFFYRDQNSLVKSSGINGSGIYQTGENFCEVLLRAHRILKDLQNIYDGKKIIFFSHSMFGAACCILLGMGQKVEELTHLAFDGNRKDGTSYIIPHSTPIKLG